MVRVNLINPKYLTDQHLVAEYLEIIMLVTNARKHSLSEDKIPKYYVLGTGHINFFKNKLKYLNRRHELIRKEMKKRGFKAKKKISLNGFPNQMKKDWRPSAEDREVIKKRLIWKINKKPNWYRYYRKNIGKKKLVEMTKNAK